MIVYRQIKNKQIERVFNLKKKVTRAGEKRPGKTQNKNYSGYVLFALIFLVVVGVSVLVAGIPVEVLFVYLAVSIITIIIYAKDKSAAREGRWRTQESTLHLLALRLNPAQSSFGR